MDNIVILLPIYQILYRRPRTIKGLTLTHQHTVELAITHRGIAGKREATCRLTIEDKSHHRLNIQLAIVIDDMQRDILAVVQLF